MLSVTLERKMVLQYLHIFIFLPSFPFCQTCNKTLSLSCPQTAKVGILSSTNLWNDSADASASSSPLLTCILRGRKRAPGDWPETQLASWPDCISIKQTTSHQTSQWRERSRRKGKWKLMNTSQVTVAQRQFTRNVFRKIQEGKEGLSKCSKKDLKAKNQSVNTFYSNLWKKEIGLHWTELLI